MKNEITFIKGNDCQIIFRKILKASTETSLFSLANSLNKTLSYGLQCT